MRTVNMRKHDNLSREETAALLKNMDKLRGDLNIYASIFGLPFGLGMRGFLHMKLRSENKKNHVRRSFIYRYTKGVDDIRTIRNEFERLTERFRPDNIGMRSEAFRGLYIDEFGHDAPYGRTRPRLDLLERCESLRQHLKLDVVEFSLALGTSKTRYYNHLKTMQTNMTGIVAFILTERLKELERKHDKEHTGEQS